MNWKMSNKAPLYALLIVIAALAAGALVIWLGWRAVFG